MLASRDNLLDRRLSPLGESNTKASARFAMVSNIVIHSKGESRERPVIFFGTFFPELEGIVSVLVY